MPVRLQSQPSLIDQYRDKVTAGDVIEDAAQAHALVSFNNLLKALRQSSAPTPPKGIYIYGEVGRGKSMLMDLFFENLDAEDITARRVHFHAFMEELHERLHNTDGTQGDVMLSIAQHIAADAQVLCFDEFYITNIADAMMLGRLFEQFFKINVVVCATSNWAPENLFQGGVSRHRFKPFIKLIEQRMDVVHMADGADYRYRGTAENTNIDPLPLFIVEGEGAGTQPKTLEKLFQSYANGEDNSRLPNDVEAKKIQGRSAWFTFDQLCGQPLDRTHYLELAQSFETIALEHVPTFTNDDANEALRFITLVDILYENNNRLICTAATEPQNLCPTGDAAQAFKRTVSRLVEMQSV